MPGLLLHSIPWRNKFDIFHPFYSLMEFSFGSTVTTLLACCFGQHLTLHHCFIVSLHHGLSCLWWPLRPPPCSAFISVIVARPLHHRTHHCCHHLCSFCYFNYEIFYELYVTSYTLLYLSAIPLTLVVTALLRSSIISLHLALSLHADLIWKIYNVAPAFSILFTNSLFVNRPTRFFLVINIQNTGAQPALHTTLSWYMTTIQSNIKLPYFKTSRSN